MPNRSVSVSTSTESASEYSQSTFPQVTTTISPPARQEHSSTLNRFPAVVRRHLRLQRYQLRERAAAPFLEGVRAYSISADKKKLLYQAGDGGANRWGVVATERPAKVGDGPINVAQLEMRVDPRAEWAQIYPRDLAHTA